MTVRTLTGLTLKEAVRENELRREKARREAEKEANYHDEIGKPALMYDV
jgi:hypothetical protein